MLPLARADEASEKVAPCKLPVDVSVALVLVLNLCLTIIVESSSLTHMIRSPMDKFVSWKSSVMGSHKVKVRQPSSPRYFCQAIPPSWHHWCKDSAKSKVCTLPGSMNLGKGHLCIKGALPGDWTLFELFTNPLKTQSSRSERTSGNEFVISPRMDSDRKWSCVSAVSTYWRFSNAVILCDSACSDQSCM